MMTRFKKKWKKRRHASAEHNLIEKHRKHPGGRDNARGKGMLLSSQPLVVKVKVVSKIVEKKIKEAGGAIVLAA